MITFRVLLSENCITRVSNLTIFEKTLVQDSHLFFFPSIPWENKEEKEEGDAERKNSGGFSLDSTGARSSCAFISLAVTLELDIFLKKQKTKRGSKSSERVDPYNLFYSSALDFLFVLKVIGFSVLSLNVNLN